MCLSSSPPRGWQQPSSFGSMDWLSPSSCSGSTHTPRPADVSPRSLPGPSQTFGNREPPQTVSTKEASSSNLHAPERTVLAPGVRAAFTTEQVRALEGVFRHHQYLGPLERKRLARETQLSEVQIKTWFQNRRMKHKRQMQDSQLNGAFSGSLHGPPAFHSPSSGLANGLQLLCPWALASSWASCCGQLLAYHPPRPGSGEHTLGPALSTGPWGLCALPETGDAFEETPLTPCLPHTRSVQIASDAYPEDSAVLFTSWRHLSP
uniref:Homeobox domain-containing protein n=1 Tax=Nomascus leucogenys TaxID=61853 RepID=A0A2I3H5V4_NOMLE